MSEELRDEISSINAIYGDDTLAQTPDPNIYVLTPPSGSSISIRIEFGADYPNVPPIILGTHAVGEDVPKGEGTAVVELLRQILSTIYQPGVPCIFDLIEDSSQQLPQLHPTPDPSTAPQQPTPSSGLTQPPAASTSTSVPPPDTPQIAAADVAAPDWSTSAVVTEKKSVFVGRAARVESVTAARDCVAHLLATDKKAARATHNITAWRVRGAGGVRFQDCDDDGESAAGARVLHLLELMDVWDVVVVVTRWYGGVLLGADRFRIINQCAREAVVKCCGGSQEESEGAPKKKAKK